jgi:hypothetical protein
MKNKFLAFRSVETMAERLSAVADREHLSVSDILRRAAYQSLRELEEKHDLIPTNGPPQPQKSAWLTASR